MTPHEIFETLLTEASHQGWPLAFKTDLNIDHMILETKEPERFVWVLREHGTHLLDARWIQQEHNHPGESCWGLCDGAIGWLEAIARVEPDRTVLIYTWQQHGLKRATLDEAVRYLTRHAPKQVEQRVGLPQYASG